MPAWLKLCTPAVSRIAAETGLNPAEHLAAGRALQVLREQNVLIIGSGLSYHNLRAFFNPQSQADNQAAQAFDLWLQHSCAQPAPERRALLERWSDAPGARQVHPREEHLLPLMLIAGAGGNAPGRAFYAETIMGKAVSALRFGD